MPQRLTAEHFKALADHALDIIIVTQADPIDPPGPTIVYVNQAFTDLTGYTAEEAIGANPRFLQRRGETDPQTTAAMRRALLTRTSFSGIIRNFSKSGAGYWLHVHLFPLYDHAGDLEYFAAIERNVTDQEAQRQELLDATIRDPLTGLLNRRGLTGPAARAWGVAGENGSVIMIDLDDLKRINDSAGHAAGDAAICSVARAIQSSVRATDYACRVGGDEFVVVLPGTDSGEVRDIARRIFAAVAAAGLSASLGVSTASGSLQDATTAADGGMYTAKSGGKNQIVFV